MADAIISTVLGTLRDLLLEEAQLLSGVTDQVEEISTELRRMQSFLKDADRIQSQDESVCNWLREMRSLAYKIEDAVETFVVEVASRRSSGGGFKKVLKRCSCILCECRSLHNLGLEIARVKDSISSLKTSLLIYDVKALGQGESSGATKDHNQWWARQTYAHQVEEYFVGMEEDIKQLVSVLVKDDRDHCVVSIWGMGGLGKTTLARKIFKHDDIRRCFRHFAWACVSQQGQIRSILQDIFMQLLPERKEEVISMGDRQLVEQLHQVQNEERCLVVLDDIWKMEDWKSLLAAFAVAGRKSKVLLTTRKRAVADIGVLYELKCLNEEESWELLRQISRKSFEDFEIEPNLQKVGIEMVRKCGGLPLAISVLGGILRYKDSLRDWIMENNNIGSYLSKGEENEEGKGEVAQVLALSFNDLPYHLKPCFLYFGIFREDEDIDVEQLYLLWMAEGMVLPEHRRGEETLMEVAEKYLNVLVQRSMVQVEMNEYSMARGRIVSCRLHDMMRDFCLEKVREEEFLKVIDFRGVHQPILLDSSSLARNACRLVIHTADEVKNVSNLTSEPQDYQQLRSFLCLNSNSKFWDKVIIWPQGMVNLENFKLLRVLKLEGYDFLGQKLSLELRRLIHLRLLSIKFSKLDALPSSIASLPFLQTLDLQVENEMKIPNVLWKMKRLRYLYLNDLCCVQEGKGKLRLHGLTELETLQGVNSDACEFADLSELTNLRFLGARVMDENSLKAVIKLINTNTEKLRETILYIFNYGFINFEEEGSDLLREVLRCGNLHILSLEAQVSKFPKYEPQFLQRLVSLQLRETKILEDSMETLGKLPQLQCLVFRNEAYLGTELICPESGFPQLKSLWLDDLPNLVNLRVDEGAMPKLSELKIWQCPLLVMVPDGVKSIKGLKELEIFNMPDAFWKRVRVINGQEGEDFHKVRHVPSISVLYLRDD